MRDRDRVLTLTCEGRENGATARSRFFAAENQGHGFLAPARDRMLLQISSRRLILGMEETLDSTLAARLTTILGSAHKEMVLVALVVLDMDLRLKEGVER